MYSSKNPENSEMLLNPEVLDSLVIPPSEGWKEFPVKTSDIHSIKKNN